MSFYYGAGGRDTYSFVSSALASEARRENKPINFDYRLASGLVVDVYLRDGLSVFGKNYRPPFIVEVDRGFAKPKVRERARILSFSGFRGTMFYISKNSSLLSLLPTSYGFKTVLLGESFLEKLSNRNRGALMYHILGDTTSSLSGNILQYLINKERRIDASETPLAKEEKEEMLIKNNDPETINSMNKNEFKAYLDADSDSSNCAVFIGNGVSIPFGSDNWSALIRNLVDRLEPFHIESQEHVKRALSDSSYALSSFVKSVLTREENNGEYEKAIRYCIYRKYNGIMHDQPSLVKTIAKAKAKYKNIPLLTYNYDTFVEMQYLHDTGSRLLSYCGNENGNYNINKLGKERVIHLHGYISYKGDQSKGIVLTDEDYFKAYLDENSWPFKAQVRALTEHVCLFVGSSMSDLFQMSLIQKAKKEDPDKKWNCFALMCFKGLEFKEKMQIIKYYKEKGVKIIFTHDYESMPKELGNLFGV